MSNKIKGVYTLEVVIEGEPNDRTPSGQSFIASYELLSGRDDDWELLGNESQVTGITHDGTLGQVLDAALGLMTEDIEKGVAS